MNERILDLFTKNALESASNSYLDLANVPELKQAMADAVLEWGTGSGGARLTTGNKTPHDELEEFIAKFKGEEAAIAFNTGYMANVGTISALCGKNDFIFSDELNHASIIDGIRLSRAKCFVYKHNDMADLERAIGEAEKSRLYAPTSPIPPKERLPFRSIRFVASSASNCHRSASSSVSAGINFPALSRPSVEPV